MGMIKSFDTDLASTLRASAGRGIVLSSSDQTVLSPAGLHITFRANLFVITVTQIRSPGYLPLKSSAVCLMHSRKIVG